MNDPIPDNPFFAPGEAVATAPDAPQPKVLNTREITVSPLEEYSLRNGDTKPFPQWLEAYLVQEDNIGNATVTEKGIIIRNKSLVPAGCSGETRKYWSEHSPLIAEAPSLGEPRKVVYVFNTLDTSYIHVLDPKTRKYLETIPAADKPDYADSEAVAEEHAKHVRALNRNLDRIRELHQADSLEELDRARENAAKSERAVAILQLPPEDRPKHRGQEDEIEVRTDTAVDRLKQARKRFNDTAKTRDQAIHDRQVKPEPETAKTYDPYNK